MRKISTAFRWLAMILSHAMCAAVAWEYCSLVWAGQYAGASAPAYVAFFLAIPFAAAIAVCLLLAKLFGKRGS